MKRLIHTMTPENPQRRPAALAGLLSVLALLAALLGSHQALADKSYRMQNVAITADLATDGAMTVSEARTYRFRGKFKYACRTFALDDRISYADFRVSEDGQPFVLSDSGEPGTYTVTRNSDEIEVRWYYRARNETRTFVIDYQVQDAVKSYYDTAVLYYKFIGEGFAKSTGNVEIVVNPPAPLDAWQVRQWAHGPLWASSSTSDQGVVTAVCEKLPGKRFFELRVLYPVESFPLVPAINEYAVTGIVEEEARWAEAANERRARKQAAAEALAGRQKVAVWLLPLLVLGVGAWFARIYRRYGTRPQVPSVPSRSGDIPDDLPPALVSYLVNSRTVAPSALMATLMDLARRGFLEFREEQELGKDFLGREKWKARHYWVLKRDFLQENSHDLSSYEEMLITFVFEQLAGEFSGDSNTVKLELEAFKNNKSKVQSFFKTWSEAVTAAGEERGFYDTSSIKGRNQGLMLGSGLLVLSLIFIPLFHEVALIPAVAAVTMIIGSLGMVHHTAEGRLREKKWKSLRSYLKGQHFRASEPEKVLDFIGPYFIYGVVLGMDRNQLNGLGSMIPADKGRDIMPWYYYHGAMGRPAGYSFGESFSTAVTSVNTAMSSTTGAGGGASGGGGGGAGGGGGGAG